MEQKTPEIIWQTIAPFFNKNEFGEGWENLRPEILVPLFHFRQTLPEGHKIIINCAYEDRPGGHGKGLAIDFRIHNQQINFASHVGLLESFLRRHDLEKHVALGIYPEWGNGQRPGFHLEAEEKPFNSPRRWGAKYERNEKGEPVRQGGQFVQKYIGYAEAKKLIGGQYST